MNRVLLLQSSLFIFHVMGSPQLYTYHGRRVCGQALHHGHSVVVVTQSYVQALHTPYVTMCRGHRLCSSYKTVYSVAYRQMNRAALHSHVYPECCPGWKRLHSLSCNHAVCSQTCMNGGTCSKPEQCVCASGWRGPQCQKDVNECSEQRPCAHKCLNTAGSYRCECRDGFRLMGDGRSCQSLPPPPPPPLPPPSRPTAGRHSHTDERQNLAENVTEEVQNLRNRVELLEKTLQMALTPFSTMFPLSAADDGSSEKTTLLSYSFRQLDRIDSLSEQIGFLEERLGACSCQDDQRASPLK